MEGFCATDVSPRERATQIARDGGLRPPWSTEARIRAHCTSCNACITSCPEGILRGGPGGTPVVDFSLNACTFCGACAEACPEAVFDLSAPPWVVIAAIGPQCLLDAGASCRSCTDACEPSALRFDLRAGRVGRVSVDAGSCTGCGACVGMCPVGAIAITETHAIAEKTT